MSAHFLHTAAMAGCQWPPRQTLFYVTDLSAVTGLSSFLLWWGDGSVIGVSLSLNGGVNSQEKRQQRTAQYFPHYQLYTLHKDYFLHDQLHTLHKEYFPHYQLHTLHKEHFLHDQLHTLHRFFTQTDLSHKQPSVSKIPHTQVGT